MKTDLTDLLPTRVSLLNRLKNWDDQESWGQFFQSYWKLIYGAAVRSGLNDAEAQDVVQETVIIVAKKMEQFRYDPAVDSFKGWLFYVTRKQIAMQFRRRARERTLLGEDRSVGVSSRSSEQIPDSAERSAAAIWDEEWERHVFEEAVAKVKQQVNPKHFQMFDLYVCKQWPVQQVAQTLGVPPAQVYLAKHRIAALIKEEVKRLEKQGGAAEPGH
jgi:RNA polymerase sigma-70 factor (ECF subfamily)